MGQRQCCRVRVWFFLALGTARGDERDRHVCGPLSFEVDGVVHELTATRMEAPHAAAAFARRMGPAFAGGGCAAGDARCVAETLVADLLAACGDDEVETHIAPVGGSEYEWWFADQDGAGHRTVKVRHYLDAYERHFALARARARGGRRVAILELGVQSGGSLDMWRAVLGPSAEIHGVDVDPRCARSHDPAAGTFVWIGDAGNATFLAHVLAAAAPLDVVLDDASHRSEDMIAAFEALYPSVRPDGGVYAIEDVVTNYWPYYDRVRAEDGLSFVEFAKRKVDELNAWNSEPRVRGARRDRCLTPPPRHRRNGDSHRHGGAPVTEFTRNTSSLHFYDGMVVFEKRPHPMWTRLTVGTDALDYAFNMNSGTAGEAGMGTVT